MRVLGYGILTLTLGLGLFGAYTYRHLNENLTNLDLREQLGDDRPDIEVPKAAGRPLNVLGMGSDTRPGQGNDPVGGGIDGQRSATPNTTHISGHRPFAFGGRTPHDSRGELAIGRRTL